MIAQFQHYILPSGDAMTVYVGDIVTNIKHPKRMFTVVSVSIMDIWVEDANSVGFVFWPEDTTIISSLYKPKTDELQGLLDFKTLCLYHKKSKFPIRTPEKQFEPWLFCTKCGTMVEKFDPMNQDEDTDPDFIIRF